MQEKLIQTFHSLGIEEIEKVTELHALQGAFMNMEYTLSNGQTIKLLEDDKTYYGAQICKKNSSRCYGLAADDRYLLVCEYGEGGSDAEVVIFKKL